VLDQYQNYHAIHALELAASSSGRGNDVYLFTEAGSDPKRYAKFDPEIEPDDPDTYPPWPTIGTEGKPTDQVEAGKALADMLRWAWENF
jgi:hypothetical protein